MNPDVMVTIAFGTYAVLVALGGIVGFLLTRDNGDRAGAE
jgi:hypothetical protein